MASRRKAREVTLQMLYQVDVNPDVEPPEVQQMIREQIPDDKLAEFAWELFAGVMEQRSQLDAGIESVAENWSLARMAVPVFCRSSPRSSVLIVSSGPAIASGSLLTRELRPAVW